MRASVHPSLICIILSSFSHFLENERRVLTISSFSGFVRTPTGSDPADSPLRIDVAGCAEHWEEWYAEASAFYSAYRTIYNARGAAAAAAAGGDSMAAAAAAAQVAFVDRSRHKYGSLYAAYHAAASSREYAAARAAELAARAALASHPCAEELATVEAENRTAAAKLKGMREAVVKYQVELAFADAELVAAAAAGGAAEAGVQKKVDAMAKRGVATQANAAEAEQAAAGAAAKLAEVRLRVAPVEELEAATTVLAAILAAMHLDF